MTSNKTSRWRRLVSLLAIAVLFLITPTAGPQAADYNDPDYRAAVEDARVAWPSEISKTLWAINIHNAELTWQGAPGASRVLVLTWTGAYYDGFEGQNYQLTYGPLWVTPAGEMRAWFEHHFIPPTVERVEKLLGLPPQSGKTRFVEMWVDPADLFRPSADPGISDCEAEIDYPVSAGSTVTAVYKTWFENLKANQYLDPSPYPWTRLGYTYDWADSEHPVGLSEFVISVKVRSADDKPWVVIHKVYTNEEYFETLTVQGGAGWSSDFSSGCFIQALP